MNLKKLPPEEKPRERLLKYGKNNVSNNELIEIILIGKRNFEINTYELNKLIFNEKIIKIKNKTKINYNLEKIVNENTLKGLFAKNIKNKLNDETLTEEEKEIVEKAIEIAFDALE